MNIFEQVQSYKGKLGQELKDIASAEGNKDERSKRLIMRTALICGTLAVINPLPLGDFFVLTPLQCLMVVHLGRVHGFEISEERAKEIIGELLMTVGWAFLAKHTIIGLYKTFLPFAGGLFSFPLVFGFTYALGRLANHYFELKARGERPDRELFRRLWAEAVKEGQELGKKMRPGREDGPVTNKG